MIAILTNDGSLQIARALSGGELFLVYGAALVGGQVETPYIAASVPATVLYDESGKESSIIFGTTTAEIKRVVPCSGILPVKISDGEVSSVAVDFDFNTQLIDGDGLSVEIKYQTVCMLGRRYRQYRSATYGTYHYGDHVWIGSDRSTAYMCVAEEYEYLAGSPTPDEDSEHWIPVSTENLLRHPGDPMYFSDPQYDTIVMHITSYDDEMTMGNGIEFEYKVRIFLDNLAQKNLSKIEKFAQGVEANGSLILSFMAAICEDLRKMRDMISPIA